MGDTLFKAAAHFTSSILAIVNEKEEIILFDADSFFSYKKDSAIHLLKSRKDKFLMWSSKSQKQNTNKKADLIKELQKISPPNGLVVLHLEFSLKGLFAFYSILGQSKCCSFKVIDEYSGAVLYSFEGLVESEVVSGGPLPLVMTDSILSMCLGVLCNDYFVMKLCEIIPDFGYFKEPEKTFPSQTNNEVNSVHFEFLKIILNLHLHIFHSSILCFPSERHYHQESFAVTFPERKALERVEELFKIVLDYNHDHFVGNDSYVKESMLIKCFFHAVHLLDLIFIEKRKILDTSMFSTILKYILMLFENLKSMNVEDPLKNDWITWSDLTDQEIVKEAVTIGIVPLAHVFFITNRNWTVEEVENQFHSIAHEWIVKFILLNDVEKAMLALKNLVCNFLTPY